MTTEIQSLPYDMALLILNNYYNNLSCMDKILFIPPNKHSNTQFIKPSQFKISQTILNVLKLWTQEGKKIYAKSRDIYSCMILAPSALDDEEWEYLTLYNKQTAIILSESIPVDIEKSLFHNSYAGHDNSISYFSAYSPEQRLSRYPMLIQEGERRILIPIVPQDHPQEETLCFRITTIIFCLVIIVATRMLTLSIY